MKTMVIADMLILKKYLPQQLAVSLFAALVMTFSMGNIYSIAPIFSFMVQFTLIFTLITLDERGNWQQFRLTLPLSRKDIVLGRYTTIIAVSLIGTICGLVVTALVGLLAYALPNLEFFANLAINLSWQAIVLACTISLALGSIILAFLMPFVTRFGMSNAVRLSPLVFFGAVFGFSLLGGNNLAISEPIIAFLAFIETPPGTFAAAAMSLTIAGILLTLSGALAIKLIENREF